MMWVWLILHSEKPLAPGHAHRPLQTQVLVSPTTAPSTAKPPETSTLYILAFASAFHVLRSAPETANGLFSNLHIAKPFLFLSTCLHQLPPTPHLPPPLKIVSYSLEQFSLKIMYANMAQVKVSSLQSCMSAGKERHFIAT